MALLSLQSPGSEADMGCSAIVAGTGFQNSDGSRRAEIIRKYCSNGATVHLRREPDNKYDSNAIAVYLETPGFLGLIGKQLRQVGYIKSKRAAFLAQKLDHGEAISGTVASFYAPAGRECPRVSLALKY